jgi:hypothetical protein
MKTNETADDERDAELLLKAKDVLFQSNRSLDPPLVTATPVSDPNEHGEVVVQAVAVGQQSPDDVVPSATIAVIGDEEDEPSLHTTSFAAGSRLVADQENMVMAPSSVALSGQSGEVQHVHIDEAPPHQRFSEIELLPQSQDHKKKSILARKWRISLILLLVFLVGGIVGVVVALTGNYSDATGGTDQPVPPVDAISTFPSPSPTTTFAPTYSVSPSMAPTCMDTFSPFMNIKNLTGSSLAADGVSGNSSDLTSAGINTGSVSSVPLVVSNETLREENNHTLGNGEILQNSTSSRKTALSFDGSTLVISDYDPTTSLFYIDTYDLSNASATGPNRTTFQDEVHAVALNGSGERLIAGTGIQFSMDASSLKPIDSGGTFYVFRRVDLDWEMEVSYEVGGGATGGVFSVAISDDGNIMAFVASDSSGAGYVSVYTVESGSLLAVDTLREDWLDSETAIDIVGQRLLVSSSDGYVRTYDLLENSLQQVGQDIENFVDDDALVKFAPLNSDVIVMTSGLIFLVEIWEFRDDLWQALNTLAFDDHEATESLVSVAVSAQGDEMMLTVNNKTADFGYTNKWFRRNGDFFHLAQNFEMNIEGAVKDTLLLTDGDLLVETESQIVLLRRESCNAGRRSFFY